MTALEYQKKFNDKFAKCVKRGTTYRNRKQLLAMYDEMNLKRVSEGIKPLILHNLETYRFR